MLTLGNVFHGTRCKLTQNEIMTNEQSPEVFVVRAQDGRHAPAFKGGGYVGIGWLPDVDLASIRSKDALYEVFDSRNPDAGSGHRIVNVGQIWRFLNELSTGNIVITPTGNRGELLVGEITSEYYFEPNPTDSPYAHRRRVKWFKETLSRSAFSVPAQNTLGSTLTVFRVAQVNEVLAKLGRTVDEPALTGGVDPSDYSAAVVKQMLELSAGDFELLMTDLLRAIGFEASHVGQVGDGGIDVGGVLQMYGFATVDLKVQVKRYAATRIGHNDISRFRGQVPEKSQAAFVTLSDFTEKARKEADRPGYKTVGLINGSQVVDLLIDHYEDLLPETKDLLRLRYVLIPQK